MNECAFGTKDETYLEYHDYFWGQPLYETFIEQMFSR